MIVEIRFCMQQIVVAITHQRQPNDEKLASKLPHGMLDLILGGHDHTYDHCVINGMHLLRSGTDFKQLSYIEARRKSSGPGWDFTVKRRDVVASIAEDPPTLKVVEHDFGPQGQAGETNRLPCCTA